MTAIVILSLLLLLAVAGPWFGADTRSPKGWSATDANQPLWSDAGIKTAR